MPQTQTRVVGSNFSTFTWLGQPIFWLDSVVDSGQEAIGGQGGYETVTPLGSYFAQDIATSRVLAPGTLTATIREKWDGPAWTQLQGLTVNPPGSINQGGVPNNIVDVFQIMASLGPISCQLVIKPPGQTTWRGNQYFNCTVVHIDDSETIRIDALTIPRNITILYTNKLPFTSTGTALL